MKKIKLFLELSWNISIKFYGLLTLSSLIIGVKVFINVYLPALFVENILLKNISIQTFNYLFMIIILNLIFNVINNYINAKLELENIYVNDKMNEKLSDKTMKIYYWYLEDPYYLDLKQRAFYAIETQHAMAVLIDKIASIIKNIVIILELLGFICTLSGFLVISITCINIIILFSYVIFKKYENNFLKNFVSTSRKFSYYLGLCFDDTLQKDIRIYNMKEMLTNKVRTQNEEILKLNLKYYQKKGKYSGFLLILNNIQSAIIYAYVAFRTFGNIVVTKLSYGQFTFYINSTINLVSASKNLISDVTTFSQMIVYLEPFIEFMQLEDDLNLYGQKKMNNEIFSLEFRNISFTYPNSEREIIKNITFKINKGEKLSIVGLNGSGKSTLVKLICRLYKPNTGRILINDYDIWLYEPNSYNQCITSVFQDYKMFAMTIAENIACEDEINTKKVSEVVNNINMGYLKNRYTNGLNTELNKAYEDEGVDLSGGEKQKLAIARALYKGGGLFILDELTSSLDPKSEAEIYDEFYDLTKDKMTIYISHRMSSSTLCDKVLVIDNGKIVGFDEHVELIKEVDSLYYRMFNAQAENYKVN